MGYRIYSDAPAPVREHYRDMRRNQTVSFVRRMEAKWSPLDKGEFSVAEIFDLLEDYVDVSDPDTEHPNKVHMFQTAERIRKAGLPDWFQLTGLIHDLGKVMYVWGEASDGQSPKSQWALGGDTWVVGCKIPDSVVFPELNRLNPDSTHPVYGTGHGMYKPGCGLEALKFAFGHDEYLYWVLRDNKTGLPEEALAMVRYHSCYALHQQGEYKGLLTTEDEDLLELVRDFNKFDLYTKGDPVPDVEALTPYYARLVDKYCPGRLRW